MVILTLMSEGKASKRVAEDGLGAGGGGSGCKLLLIPYLSLIMQAYWR